MTLSNCTFTDNVGVYAGAVNLQGSNATVTGCIFRNNTASPYTGDSPFTSTGGALCLNNSHNIRIDQSQFIGNSAGVGGAIVSFGAVSSLISGSQFVNNSAFVSGGAVAEVNCNGCQTITSSYTGNQAAVSHTEYPSTNNTGDQPIEVSSATTAVLKKGSFTLLTVVSPQYGPFYYQWFGGGAMYSSQSIIAIANVSFTGNAAIGQAHGGAVLQVQGNSFGPGLSNLVFQVRSQSRMLYAHACGPTWALEVYH